MNWSSVSADVQLGLYISPNPSLGSAFRLRSLRDPELRQTGDCRGLETRSGNAPGRRTTSSLTVSILGQRFVDRIQGHQRSRRDGGREAGLRYAGGAA